jgi:hypothetical protein
MCELKWIEITSLLIFYTPSEMSLLPKALAAVLAPMDDFPRLYSEPLREIIVHGPLWSTLAGLCGRRPPKTNTKKKTDDDPIEIVSNHGSKAIKVKTILTKADLV